MTYAEIEGNIIAANNPTVSLNYPHVIDREADHGYRARCILDMIEKGYKKGVEELGKNLNK